MRSCSRRQLSLAFTGAVTDHIGAWLQLTYFQQTGTFGIDTWEVRYADQTANKNWLWGVLFNNDRDYAGRLQHRRCERAAPDSVRHPEFSRPLTSPLPRPRSC